jgi:hypothetical protein
MQRLGGRRGAYMALVGNPEVKRTLGRPRRKWKDIKMEGMDRIDLTQVRDRRRALVNAVMNVRLP